MNPLLKKRILRAFEKTPKGHYKGDKLRSFCEFCAIDIEPSTDNVCRFCRKSFCQEHWRAPDHNCRKRLNDPHLRGVREIHHAGGSISAG